jgi:hypothetical protein
VTSNRPRTAGPVRAACAVVSTPLESIANPHHVDGQDFIDERTRRLRQVGNADNEIVAQVQVNTGELADPVFARRAASQGQRVGGHLDEGRTFGQIEPQLAAGETFLAPHVHVASA